MVNIFTHCTMHFMHEGRNSAINLVSFSWVKLAVESKVSSLLLFVKSGFNKISH